MLICGDWLCMWLVHLYIYVDICSHIMLIMLIYIRQAGKWLPKSGDCRRDCRSEIENDWWIHRRIHRWGRAGNLAGTVFSLSTPDAPTHRCSHSCTQSSQTSMCWLRKVSQDSSTKLTTPRHFETPTARRSHTVAQFLLSSVSAREDLVEVTTCFTQSFWKLISILDGVTTNNSISVWMRLLNFPRRCLWVPKRGGYRWNLAKHVRQQVDEECDP